MFISALFFGFLLGIKHALDADHIVAVTTIVSRNNSFFRSALVGLIWGIGHTITLFAAGFAVLVLKLTIPDRLALSMEFVVGVALVLMGIPLIKQLVVLRVHAHLHQHEDKAHLDSHSQDDTSSHHHKHIKRPLLMGMIHGLAGSGVLIPLVMSTMPSVAQGLFFLFIFGIGSILGMIIFSGLIGLPFRFTARFSLDLSLWVQGVAGAISVVLGLFIMYRAGFAGGLFLPAI